MWRQSSWRGRLQGEAKRAAAKSPELRTEQVEEGSEGHRARSQGCAAGAATCPTVNTQPAHRHRDALSSSHMKTHGKPSCAHSHTKVHPQYTHTHTKVHSDTNTRCPQEHSGTRVVTHTSLLLVPSCVKCRNTVRGWVTGGKRGSSTTKLGLV